MLQHQYGNVPPYYAPHQPYGPYPQQRAIPQYENRRSGCHCCLRFICCVYCLLFLLIFFMALGLVLTYTFYKPKIPIYKLEDFSVTSFNVQPDMSIGTHFMITVRAENPNTRIGFIYGKDSTITVSFEGSVLCSGKMPAFHQGHENVTMINIPLAGNAVFGSELHKVLTDDQHQGRIPLIVQVKVPVTVVMDTIPLRQFEFHVSCHVTVDDLKPDKKPKILSTTYTFGIGI
ncbi:NDR1/HIN1-like protein 6 [Chenopodium quinoa]|uniref:NDR1/HIN1-like protein 6 n=1 Tax=Chenopodium quinoa TaxID=63459 RepID=UPI000B787CB6|nr:NDR1/HIN1-like protein 6 [Chenopodium quinoa]